MSKVEKVYRFVKVKDVLNGGRFEDLDPKYKQAITLIESKGINIEYVALDDSLLDLAEIVSGNESKWKMLVGRRDDHVLPPYGYGFAKENLLLGKKFRHTSNLVTKIMYQVINYYYKDSVLAITGSEIESLIKMTLFYLYSLDNSRNKQITYAEFLEQKKDYIDSCVSGRTNFYTNDRQMIDVIRDVIVLVLYRITDSEEILNFTISDFRRIVGARFWIYHFLNGKKHSELTLKWFRSYYVLGDKVSYNKSAEIFFEYVKTIIAHQNLDVKRTFDVAVDFVRAFDNLEKSYTISTGAIFQYLSDCDEYLSLSEIFSLLNLLGNNRELFAIDGVSPAVFVSRSIFVGGFKALRFLLEIFENGKSLPSLSFPDLIKAVDDRIFDTPYMNAVDALRLHGIGIR